VSKVDLIIFGATGDLSARKLFPALFHLDVAGLLPNDLRISAVARQEQHGEAFLSQLRSKMNAYLREGIDDNDWHRFAERIDYITC
jgi:glucose-6-phosphate 1-dehydrogenase